MRHRSQSTADLLNYHRAFINVPHQLSISIEAIWTTTSLEAEGMGDEVLSSVTRRPWCIKGPAASQILDHTWKWAKDPCSKSYVPVEGNLPRMRETSCLDPRRFADRGTQGIPC
jgi:hypothetical protein